MEKFCVEMIEPGCFQSVFPVVFAELGQLHSSKADAQNYIKQIKAELKAYPAYCKEKLPKRSVKK